jgi:hypothetical protein
MRQRGVAQLLKYFEDLALGAVWLDDGVDIGRHGRMLGDDED